MDIRRFFRLYLRTIVGGVVLLMVALVSAVYTMRGAIHGDEVAVPNLSGLSMAEAESMTEHLGLGLGLENRYYSTIVPIGRVIAQSPAAGTVVRREWQVRVTESLGPQKVAIPDVMGQPLREAAIAIERVGLDLGSVARLPGTGNEADIVIAQSPPPTATGADRPRVSLLLSEPEVAEGTAYVMPDLTGLGYSAASAMVVRAGLRMGPVETKSAAIPAVSMGAALTPIQATVKPGMVLGQVPSAGSKVMAGDVVKLVVAR